MLDTGRVDVKCHSEVSPHDLHVVVGMMCMLACNRTPHGYENVRQVALAKKWSVAPADRGAAAASKRIALVSA